MTVSRRRLLSGAGALGLGVVGLGGGALAACGAPPVPAGPAGTPAPPSAPPTTSTPSGTYTGDLQAVALCAALAAFAADLYGDAASLAGQGRFGGVPAVVAGLLGGAATQHTTAAAAWNEVLTAAGRPAVTGTPLTVEGAYRSRLDAATAPVDVLGLVVDLEAVVGATVVARLGELTDPGAVAVGAEVAPVAAMHGATASFLLGRLPVAPADPTAGALGREALTA